jgi:plasmid stabilization system protein ParE
LLTPTTAAKTVKHIEDEIRKNLSYMPYYPLVDDDNLASIGVRRMVVKKYLVFFVIDEEKKIVNVIRIIHGAREWKRLLPE